MAVLAAMLITLPALGQDSTRKDFDKLCSDMVGRWVGDVTWITDWPGFGKKGDKVTAYWEGRMSEDGNVLIGKFLGGDGSSTGMIFYDAVAKKIRATTVTSAGSVEEAVCHRDGKNWVQLVQFKLPDGTKGKVKSVGTITDGGKTWTWTMNGKVGDDEIKDQQDVWRRVSD
jgi:hypothetical protein